MRIYRLGGKSWKDKKKKQFITLYHISNTHLKHLMPRSKLLRTGKTGLFLSPSYKSVIVDWALYVQGKKHKNHPLDLQIKALNDEFNKLKDLKDQTPEVIARIEEIETKMDKIRETTKDENKAYRDSISGYKTLYLHTISCPIEVFNEAKAMMEVAYENDPNKSWGFWGWGAQIFIEAKYLSQLDIIKVKKFDMSQFNNEYKNISLKRYVDDPFMLYRRQFDREEAIRKKKREEEAAKNPVDPNRYDYKKEMEQRRKEWDEYWAKKKLERAERTSQ